ncbi:MAG: signal peptidase I [Candidatus Nanohaloarchaea archaeon]|jgi:signal peptidase I
MDPEIIPEEATEYLDTFFFLTIAVLLAFGSLQTAGTVMGTERPVVSVVSCSMYPALNVGDILLVNGIDFDQIEEEDIVVYNVDKQAVLSVGGEKVNLDSSNTSAETAAGEITLIGAQSTEEGGYALLDIEGETVRMEIGETISRGTNIRLNYAAGMDIPVVHRVIEKEETYLETKGDNNPKQIPFEKRVEPEQIYGTSIFRIPRLGGVKLLAMDFLGLNGGKPILFDTYPVCQETV